MATSKKSAVSAERPGVGERMLDRAEAIIAERGLAALGVRELVAAADCSPGSLYYLYGDLDGVVVGVNRRTLLRLDAALAAATCDAAEPRETLDGLAMRYLAFAVAETRLLRALFEHRMSDDRPFPDEHLALVAATFSRIETPLRRLLPEAAVTDVEMLARTLFSAAHGIIGLGLEKRITAVPLAHLERQLLLFIAAFVAGLDVYRPSSDRMSGGEVGRR